MDFGSFDFKRARRAFYKIDYSRPISVTFLSRNINSLNHFYFIYIKKITQGILIVILKKMLFAVRLKI